MINTSFTPIAMAIWGHYLPGYKTFNDANSSVFMIAYSKGDIEILMTINSLWSLIFMFVYYILPIFILHSAFHMA